MQVSNHQNQHEVMIEAVENHMPEIIIIDEIGTELEAAAALTIAERGVQLVGTAHGNTLENLIKNPTIKQINLAKKALYFFESGKFISKKITAKNWVKDKIFKSFFINFFGMGMKYNDYIKLIHNMLIKDIFKSKVFNEIKKLV